MTMNEYEAMFIANPDHGADGVKKTFEAVTGILEKQGAKIQQMQEWGKRRLGYLIKGKAEGSYALYNFTMDPSQMARVTNLLNLNDDLLKYMVITKPVPKKLKPTRVPPASKLRPMPQAVEAAEGERTKSW